MLHYDGQGLELLMESRTGDVGEFVPQKERMSPAVIVLLRASFF